MDVLSGCKVTYFNIFMGRAGPIKLALALAGIEYEEVNVEFADWPAMKASTPFGGLPVVELKDGTRIAQTRCILRFIGKYTGSYPKDEREAARVDAVMDAAEDVFMLIVKAGEGMEQEAKEAERKKAIESGAPFQALSLLEKFCLEAGDGEHSVGSSITIADLLIATLGDNLVSGMLDGVPPTALEPFPTVQAVRKTVAKDPIVAKWVDASPHTEAAERWKAMRD